MGLIMKLLSVFLVLAMLAMATGCDNPVGSGNGETGEGAELPGGDTTGDEITAPGGTDFDFVVDPAGPFVLTPRLEMFVSNSFQEYLPQEEPIVFVAPLDLGITLPGLTTPQNLSTAAFVDWDVSEGEEYVSMRLLEPKDGQGFEFIATPIPDTRAEGQPVERTVKFRARVVDPASPAAPPAEHVFTVTIPPDPSGNLTTIFEDGTVRYRFLIPAGYSAIAYTITLRPAGATGAENDKTITGNFPATFNDDITFARDYVPDFTALQEQEDRQIPFGRYIPRAEVTMTNGGGTVPVGDLADPPPEFRRVWAFPAWMWDEVSGEDSWAVFEVPELETEEPEPGPITYSVGDFGPAGGVIFYVRTWGDPDSENEAERWRYLEAAPSTWHSSGNVDPRFVFRSSNSPTVRTFRAGIGGGPGNTETIRSVLEDPANPARFTGMHAARAADTAVVTHGGATFTDWFLPTRDELTQLYNLVSDPAHGTAAAAANMQGGMYWSSSTDTSGTRAATASFTNGRRYVIDQDTDWFVPRVRPVRRF